MFDSDWFEDQRLISKWDAFDVFHGLDIATWTIADVTVRGIGDDLFCVEVVFQNFEFENQMREQAKAEQTLDYEMLILPISLTWEEFASAIETHENLISLIERIHRDFLARKQDLNGYYSTEAKRLIDYLDALGEGD